MIPVNATVNRPPKGAVMLELHGGLNTDANRMLENARAAMASGFPILQERGRITQQPLLIVGDSPDLHEHLDKIKALKESGVRIMAVKRTHDWLIERGIVPDMAISCDAQANTVDIFKARRQGVTYYCGSVSHPDMWDYMRGFSCVIWHPKLHGFDDATPEWKGVKKVTGGCTTGLRAISLAWILGYRNQILVGFQSCVSSNGVMRETGGKTFAHDEAFPVHYAGQWFWTTANLAQQVQDLMPTLMSCPGIKVDVIGDGALPHVLRTGKAGGWPV